MPNPEVPIIFVKTQPKAAEPSVIYYKNPLDEVAKVAAKAIPKVANTSKLVKNQQLKLGESLFSQDKVFQFILQKDGNLVLLNHYPVANNPIWHANAANQGGVRVVMQDDGNLVLYNSAVQPIWASGTQGHPGAFFAVQTDGNAVLYDTNNSPLWETRTWGGAYHDEPGNWLTEAVKTAGKPFAAAAHGLSEAWTTVGNALGEIPIIGPALHGVFAIAGGPFTFTDRVIQGERLDRALIQDFRDKLSGIREVAPYAQTILSFVPGIGSGVAAAIGAGLAIAQGRPIDEAILEGVKSAVPGGPMGRAVYGLAVNAATGKNLIKSAADMGIDALGLPPAATEGLHKALNVAEKAANGENIPLAALQEARSYLPNEETKQAFDIAVAMAQGKRLQDTLLSQLKNLPSKAKDQISNLGKTLISENPALQSIANKMSQSQAGGLLSRGAGEVRKGYEFGLGVMRHGGVNEQNLNTIRNQLKPDERQGFDTAVGVYKTAVTTHVPSDTPPDEAGKVLVAKGTSDNPNGLIKTEAMKYFLVPSMVPQKVYHILPTTPIHENGLWAWFKDLVGL